LKIFIIFIALMYYDPDNLNPLVTRTCDFGLFGASATRKAKPELNGSRFVAIKIRDNEVTQVVRGVIDYIGVCLHDLINPIIRMKSLSVVFTHIDRLMVSFTGRS
jgi:hypothetical protein